MLGGLAALATALLQPAPAWSQAPVIAGDYVASFRVYCQPVLAPRRNHGELASVTLNQNAPTTFSIELEYYDPRTTIVTATGFTEAGSSLLLHDNLRGDSGTPFAETRDAEIFFYSNDQTSVTINGITYQVTWGHLQNTQLFAGVPQYFALSAVDADGCLRQSVHVRR